MTSNNRLIVWIRKNEVKRDSSFLYYISEKKVNIQFKFKNYKGACDFTLIDSLNNIIIKGGFSNGLALLRDQNEAFTVDYLPEYTC